MFNICNESSYKMDLVSYKVEQNRYNGYLYNVIQWWNQLIKSESTDHHFIQISISGGAYRISYNFVYLNDDCGYQ